jgi:hypothetical protein
MLGKEALKEHNRNFWKTFHHRMRETRSRNGKGINWLQYPTNLKNLYVRLEATKNSASFYVDLQWKDEGIRSIVYEQMTELKAVMTESMKDPGEWLESFYDAEGQEISRIRWTLPGVNYYKELDHSKIYDFLEEKLRGFDEFYQEYKEILILLVQ